MVKQDREWFAEEYITSCWWVYEPHPDFGKNIIARDLHKESAQMIAADHNAVMMQRERPNEAHR